jgi:acyl dehydratase
MMTQRGGARAGRPGSVSAMVDKSIVGKTGKPFSMPIEWSKVREFARAVRDPNPIYFDPELAKKECGGIPVPVTFLQTSAFWQTADSAPPLDIFDPRRILHGEQEFEFFAPILVGDTLTGLARVVDVYEKEGGRGGKMTFLAVETTYTNQRDEKVARSRFVLVETGHAVGG